MLTSVLLVGSVLAAQALTAANDDLQLEVRRLVRQLDAARLAEREAAEEELLKLGPEVLDLLPEVDDRTPAEVRQRLGRIRQGLQLALAQAVASPSLVTLSGDAMPLSKVLAAIRQQSGNRIVDYRDRFGQKVPDPDLKIDFDKTPFWQALDQVMDLAGLTMYPYGDLGEISLVGRQAGMRSETASYAGPFRFQPFRVEAVRDLRVQDGQSLRLALWVTWEPRLKLIGLKQRMADLKAVDENGNPLTVDNSLAAFDVLTSADTSAELILPFALPPREVKQIASLKGKLMVMLAGKVETFSFDELTKAKNVDQRIAAVAVTLEQVRQNRSIWEVRIRVRFDDAGQALESHRGWILDNEAYLESPDGEQMPFDNLELTGQSDNELSMAYGFVLDGPPEKHKFIYKTPGTIITTDFDYEIKNVDLP